MDFGARLKSERKKLRLTQTQLAAIAHTTKNSQLNYEKNIQKPGADYLMVMAEIGIDVQYLLTGVRPNLAQNSEEQTLLQFYRSASPAIRQATLAVLMSGGLGGCQGVTVNGVVTGGVVAHTINGK